ncbi:MULTISPECIES: DMT family transporter [Pseudomonas]|uniref:DMT family transporter n=1 Tax=Pseudomonas TaxID=286 RepID=UPI001BE666A1|nr:MULTISPECIES: DMT family transporter [Pseudomonas]MBT2341564.1 DMT family transporter [Pseudomonas fluorescens]MCD4531033.1 DMT family transporter [Pseudomonas sp. C3-2018]
MTTRRALDGQVCALMTGLCAIWGFQQVAIKASAADMAPMLQLGLRSAIAAVLVWLLVRARGERLSLADGSWRPGLLVGLLFALEFVLVGEGLRHTTASHMVIFLYTAPMFAALGLHWKLPSERLKPLQWTGIGVAFAGVVVAFSGGSGAANGSSLLGDGMGLLAGVLWGATTVTVRCSRLTDLPASQTLLYQLVGAGVVLIALAAILGQATTINPTPQLLASLAFQVLLVSFASFLIWFSLLRRYLASQLGVLSFMTPLYGIGFGVWLLNEPLEPNFIAGAVLVLSGILLVSGYGWIRERWGQGAPLRRG